MKTDPRNQSCPAKRPARRILILHSRALTQLVAIRRRCHAKMPPVNAPIPFPKTKAMEVAA